MRNVRLSWISVCLLMIFSCRGTPVSHTKIVGGKPVEGHYAFYGNLQVGSDSICGATLLGHDFGVTAAHCVHDLTSRSLGINIGNEGLRSVKAVLPHPGYDPVTKENDIALFFIEAQESDPNIDYNSPEEPLMSRFRVIGMGNATSIGMLGTKVLREVDIELIDNEVCERARSLFGEKILCAGAVEGGKDSCQGDSGGALFIPASGVEPARLIGIVSHGQGCAQKNQAGIYTRVSPYREWIQASVREFRKPSTAEPRSLLQRLRSYCYAKPRDVMSSKGINVRTLVQKRMDIADSLILLPSEPDWKNGLIELDRCQMLIDEVDMELVFAKPALPLEGYRVFARLGAAWYEIESRIDTFVRWDCSSKGTRFRTLQVTFSPDEADLSLKMDGAPYALERVSKPDYSVIADCSVDKQQLILGELADSREMVLQVSAEGFPEALFYRLSSPGLKPSSFFRANVQSLGAHDVILDVTMNADDDLYSWKWSCNFEFSLQDPSGKRYESQPEDGMWSVLFESPFDENGSMRSGETRRFLMHTPGIDLAAELAGKVCMINGFFVPLAVP